MHANTIHIWTGRFSVLIGDGIYTASILSRDEVERASKFVFDRDRDKYIAGRSILRRILSHYTSSAPAQIRFDYNEFGKPAIEANARIIFNVSHSEDLLCIAVATTGDGERPEETRIGVDVENYSRDIPFSEVAQSHFSSEEVANLERYEDKRRPFFRCWTRKEAYIKAHGSGVSYGLDSFGVSLGEDSRTSVDFDRISKADHWLIYSWEEDDAYFGALATDTHFQHIEHRSLEESLQKLAS